MSNKLAKRDEFSSKTKRALAERVAWRCSFPGCSKITIGPRLNESNKVVIMGEAAHITAAAPGGARYEEGMSREERRDIGNGIWMCVHHATLVDKDADNFPAKTLRNWKRLAENEAYKAVCSPETTNSQLVTTLVAMGQNIVFEGIWLEGGLDKWRFRVERFVIGNEVELIEFCSTCTVLLENERFVVVESQGDGRVISTQPIWSKSEIGYLELEIPIAPRAVQINPVALGTDLAIGQTGDIFFDATDLALVSGVDNARQRIKTTLSTEMGSWAMDLNYGSLCGMYYRQFKNNLMLLSRLFVLDMARLATIPHYDSMSHSRHPILRFVLRVEEVTIESADLNEKWLPFNISLYWSNREKWNGSLSIWIEEDENEIERLKRKAIHTIQNPPSKQVPDLLLQTFKKLTEK